MFSFFKKKPKFSNEAREDLAIMLTDYPEDPTLNAEYFDDLNMDYSLESLKHIDDYLESLREDLPENDNLVKVTLRCGSNIGEVIRKHASKEFNWLEHKEAGKVNKLMKEWDFGLATANVLWSSPDDFVFPLGKVLKRLENGAEDSVYFFVEVITSGEYSS